MTVNILDHKILETPFQVTDLKQWVYCPRILYYRYCLPAIRPTTYKMEAGVEAGRQEIGRELRRSLNAYNLVEGRKEFEVEVISTRLGLRGKVDLVIFVETPHKEEVIPVDYKLSSITSEHFQLQLAAYGLILEETTGFSCRRGFLYSIPERKAEKVFINAKLRKKLTHSLEEMHRMLWRESIPEPTPRQNKCVSCEFRRFCNDVL